MQRKTVGKFVVIGMMGLQMQVAQAEPPVVLTPGIKLRGNAQIKPGTYRLSDPNAGIVQISGNNFTIDFQGAKIIGSGERKGIGIHITDSRNVTIKNADVSECHWGVVVESSTGVKLLNCTSSRNADLPPGTVIDESGKQPEDQWGGGFLLRDSRKCLVQRCTAQYQWDGIDVIRSEENVIEDGDFSYSGNWGLHLWNSSRNIFRRNRAIWCTTGAGTLFQALTGWQTYDSQAVGIDHNSNENTIEGNDLRFGGDAIFIRANEGPITPGTVVPPKNGSHRNRLLYNDCSFSPNNAIEVDLVDDTVIEGNNCSYSNYGMWLGYSRRCIIKNNIAINCSNHAVEIENGQDDLFENNVFGWDTPRPNGSLVYLRQNGRDKTPSAGHIFKSNTFYGAGTGVLLRKTAAGLKSNTILPQGMNTTLVTGDAELKFIAADNSVPPDALLTTPVLAVRNAPLVPGSLVTLRGSSLQAGTAPPIVEIEGIPVWVRKFGGNSVTFWMPADLWDRPAKPTVQIRLFNGHQMSKPIEARVVWAGRLPRIDTLAPNPARIGDTLTVTGSNLSGGRVLLNNKPATVLSELPTRLTLRLPEGILTPTRYNLLFERGKDAERVTTWPVTFELKVPTEQLPHILSATFSPQTLKVGELLKVTFVVRNNLPSVAPLTTEPKPEATYEERQAYWERGVAEQNGTLHLRVTSDRPAGHDPGSWPWLFGFDRASLAPGETTTVTGYIKVQTPGEIEFRVGLVATGGRFIDDNAFRTKITVTK